MIKNGGMMRRTLASNRPDRYEAAIRLERIRHQIRDLARWGFPVTSNHMAERRDAEVEYDAATNFAEG